VLEAREVCYAVKTHVYHRAAKVAAIQLSAQFCNLAAGGEHHGMIAKVAQVRSRRNPQKRTPAFICLLIANGTRLGKL